MANKCFFKVVSYSTFGYPHIWCYNSVVWVPLAIFVMAKQPRTCNFQHDGPISIFQQRLVLTLSLTLSSRHTCNSFESVKSLSLP